MKGFRLAYSHICDHKEVGMTHSVWQGRVALVSGAGAADGIGMAIARRLGQAGARLIISASSARIHERVAELRAEGFEVEGRPADLTDEAQVRELAAWAEGLWGRIDVLVNNAGMAMQGSPEHFAELADCETRSNIWAEKFDGWLTANDLFSIQDEIVHQVTARIADSSGLITHTLLKESGPKSPETVSAYDAILGYHHWASSFALDRFKYALEALERTVAADPDYALPVAMLADIYASDYQLGYGLRPNGLEDSLILANRAVSLDAGCQFAYWALALNYFLRSDQDRFEHAVNQIIPLNPANTYTMAGAGLLIGMADSLDKGNEIMRKAFQLNPRLPSWFHIIPFMVYYQAGNYEAALTEALQINTPDCFWDPMLRAAAYGRLDLAAEAEAALKHLLELQPAFIKQQDMLLQALLYLPEHVGMIHAGLAHAGLKS